MTYIIKNKDCWHLKNFIKKVKQRIKSISLFVEEMGLWNG